MSDGWPKAQLAFESSESKPIGAQDRNPSSSRCIYLNASAQEPIAGLSKLFRARIAALS
jgi:hypothetical protein